MKISLFTISFLFINMLCLAQDKQLYATQFKTDGGVMLSTQRISAPVNSKASTIEFFTREEENPTAYYPFGDISHLEDEFEMLNMFSDNIPFNYDAGSTKFYLCFNKEKTTGNNYVLKLADHPIVKSVDESGSMYYLPTTFESKSDAEKLVKTLKENFDQDYYDQFVSFGKEQ
ncbi:hypothetical protein [Marinigracilibium pacificum]|uniref:Uncharacterized protein n=1 Tax=Marinigracilibium pacificum TaxID=2729599 RepID=A0A848J6E0_9BACT|nr:hypothetical protein [Marinigracilibium pacificum]NMM50808.1 hypothetical protein [Marinigracilibium pacificum]